MKFQPDNSLGTHIQAYTANSFQINGALWAQAVLVDSQSGVRPWLSSTGAEVSLLEHLSAPAFSSLVELQAEIVLLGTGKALRHIHPQHYRALIDKGIGVEVMDTAAACRTFNVLSGEGRIVVAALLLQNAA